MNILVAEDNPDDVVLLEHAFRRAGIKKAFTTVADGVETLKYLNGEGLFADRSRHPFPDVLLLDLNMPVKNGFEVLESVRADARLTRLMIHVLTASSRLADVERAYALHANSYTVKPTRLDELASFVQSMHQWHKFITLARPPEERLARIPPPG